MASRFDRTIRPQSLLRRVIGRPRRLQQLGLLLLLGSITWATTAAAVAPTPTLVVLAAASLTDVLEAVDTAFSAASGIPVKASYAASSTLARQIEAGARADAFLSADEQWMDYLQQRALLAPGTRGNLLGNTLVLIAPADSTTRLVIGPHFALAQALGSGRLAVADPDSVPAGRYAQAALTTLQVWGDVQGQLVRGENVRTALMYVARGEAPLGIVYGTDARAQPKVRVIDTFPADSHPPIVYPVALTVSAQPAARQWLQFLQSEQARRIFAQYGFLPGAARQVHPGSQQRTRDAPR